MYAELVWQKPLREWDMEELARGKPRNKKGNFQGPTPGWVTPEVQKEVKRRLMSRTRQDLSLHLSSAINVIKDLMESEEVDDKGRPLVDARTRLAAAMFIIENTIGKPKALLEISDATDNVKAAIAAAIVLDDGLPQDHHGEIVEAEIVEEEEDDDDE